MSSNQNNKRSVESILVASGDQRLVNFTAAAAALPGGGVRAGAATDIPLMSVVNTGFVNLFPGQLGVFCASPASVRTHNATLLSTDTYNQAQDIFVAVGGTTAQNPGVGAYPLTNSRPYETSGTIIGRHYVVCTGRVAAFDASSSWSITPVTAPSDLTEYSIHAAYHGQAMDTENSIHAYEQNTLTFTTPDYTTLGLVSDLDHFVQNFAYVINRNSKAFWGGSSIWGANEPMVAFAVELLAGADTDINNAAFDAGGIVPVFIRNGQTYSLNLTAGQVASLRLSIPATHGIKTIDITTAGNVADALYMVVLALDRDLVYEDRIAAVKIRLDLGLGRGFSVVDTATEDSFAFEGEGKGRNWVLYYESSAGQRKQAQFQRQHFPFIEVASGIDPNEYYNVYVIEHRSVGEIGIANASVSPKKTVILVPSCDATTANDIETMLNTWIPSLPTYNLMENGAGVAALSLGTVDATYCA